MFDLEAAIANWRRDAISLGTTDRSILTELEDHLREAFSTARDAGQQADEAWRLATAGLGEPAEIGREFAKLHHLPILDRVVFTIFLGVAAILAISLVTFVFNRDLPQPGSPWLTSHVIVLTLGYLAGLLATLLASYTAVRRLQSRGSTLALTRLALRAVRWACIATAALTGVACVLGWIWASTVVGLPIIGGIREVAAIVVILSFSMAAIVSSKRRSSDRAALAFAILSGGTIIAAWLGVVAGLTGWQLLPTSLALGGLAMCVAMAGIALAGPERAAAHDRSGAV